MIEVGDFVRIDSDFRLIGLGIGKVIKINQDTIYVKMNLDLPISLKIENVTKHSKNIIDLIEVGDYVNGKLIHKIDKGQNYCYLYYGNCKTFVDYQIKTILTKEQYMQNCYKCQYIENGTI